RKYLRWNARFSAHTPELFPLSTPASLDSGTSSSVLQVKNLNALGGLSVTYVPARSQISGGHCRSTAWARRISGTRCSAHSRSIDTTVSGVEYMAESLTAITSYRP